MRQRRTLFGGGHSHIKYLILALAACDVHPAAVQTFEDYTSEITF